MISVFLLLCFSCFVHVSCFVIVLYFVSVSYFVTVLCFVLFHQYFRFYHVSLMFHVASIFKMTLTPITIRQRPSIFPSMPSSFLLLLLLLLDFYEYSHSGTRRGMGRMCISIKTATHRTPHKSSFLVNSNDISRFILQAC